MTREVPQRTEYVVVGGGPAGLTAAYELTRHGHKPLVLEKDKLVGGISRTESYKGFHFDMGGHRFFTKCGEVNEMWREVMGDDFLRRPRLSRIFYNGRFFDYPLKPFNALAGLGPVESTRILFSYARWRLFPHKVEETFEQWVVNRFGDRLFRTFFKTYTEKVWGISTSELKAEWAAQRIKDLSLKTAVISMFLKPRHGKITTLIDQFDYPRRGPGMLWDAVRSRINARGGEVRMGSGVSKIRREGLRVTGVTVGEGTDAYTIDGARFVSSMPLTEMVRKMDPPAPREVLEACDKLKYRDFLTVCVIVNKPDLFPDNWIYVHDPAAIVGRIQNFKNWSPEMLPAEHRQAKTSLGLEYFCNEGDDIWTMADADLVELARKELDKLGLAKAADVEDGAVFRVPKSYPVYDSDYVRHLGTVRQWVDTLDNCRTVGRNGLHRYNNQDHSMLTGMYAARELAAVEGFKRQNLWEINADKSYHEEIRENEKLDTPGDVSEADAIEADARAAFGRIDPVGLGVSFGAVGGLLLGLMTAFLLLTTPAGQPVGPTLSLLGQYLPGYTVSWAGVLLGLIYGSLAGFGAGWLVATLRNAFTFTTWVLVRGRAERAAMRRLLEFI